MPSIAQRKEAELKLKLETLESEFQEWITASADGAAFEKHHSQILAITGHLQGLRDAVAGLSIAGPMVLKTARNVQSLILGIRRVWEYFRSKLVQRNEQAFRYYLRAADELAWSCYEPLLRLRCPDPFAACRREPPLVFLNGGLSPFALARDRAFQAEEVAGELLPEDRKLQKALKQLPISVIGVPWYQVGHLPDALVIAHETGHAVESDFGLKEEVKKAIQAAVPGARAPAWQEWQDESFADLYGCLTTGPAYLTSLIDFLAIDPDVVKTESRIAPAWGAYPTTQLRILLCREALRLTGFDKEAGDVATQWSTTYSGDHLMSAYDADLPNVAKAVLQAPLQGLAGKSLTSVPGLLFTRAEWNEAQTVASFLNDNSEPTDAQSPRALFAGARILYDQKPADFSQPAKLVLDRFEHLIKPGTRALDEDEMDASRRQQLVARSQAAGKTAFDSFAAIFAED